MDRVHQSIHARVVLNSIWCVRRASQFGSSREKTDLYVEHIDVLERKKYRRICERV